MNAHNTFENPTLVKRRQFAGAKASADGLAVLMPKMSIVALGVK